MLGNRPRSRAPRQLILLASIHFLRGLSAVVMIGFLLATPIFKDPHLLIGSAISLAILAVAGTIHLAEANKIRCPVCSTALFAHTGCSKHKTARRLFWSYRLHTAA